jgi:heterodisulfide reductase subunit A
VDDQYNAAIGKRKAAYIKYPQTVPLKYAIDDKNCLYFLKGKCRACEKFCPTGAINFQDKPKTLEINVGSILLAPGYRPFDPKGLVLYGYGEIPDVVTGLEYERLLSAGGPFQGHLVRLSDHKEPRCIAWIQCAGSRSTSWGNRYCSSVCCMYAVKQALVTAEHLQGDGVSQTIFFMDLRSHNKEFERYYEDARSKGVRFIRARPHSIEPGANRIGVRIAYSTEDGERHEEDFDMAVLSIGMEPPEEALELARICGIALNEHNFASTEDFRPVATNREGIYVCGAFQEPKAIPRSVTEASAAACEAAASLRQARGTLTSEKTYPSERDVSALEPRVGVFVCSCGINIAGVVDVKDVAAYAQTLPFVVHVENNLFTCSTDTQQVIAERIKEKDLNRVVIAACTPRTHEALFQDTLREAGLNAYLIEMANIRNQGSWVHQKEPAAATAKAKDQVRMAVAKAVLNKPLGRMSVPVVQRALVVGGGISGMTAAMRFAEMGVETVLVEKDGRLGGNAWHLNKTFKGEDVREALLKTVAQVENHPRITVFKNAEVVSAKGSVGNFESEVRAGDRTLKISYGVAVLATGGKEWKPTEYDYGKDERIMTHLEFDREMKERGSRIKGADHIVFIQCVGSREPKRLYCSRLCCSHTVHTAIDLKELNPHVKVTVLYRDIRTYGLKEELYQRARRLGVVFMRYGLENKPRVSRVEGRLRVSAFDHVLGREIEIQADYLVLASAIVPNDIKELSELYKFSVNQDGFINEAHPKLRPVEMTVDGMFLAGLCHHPKPIDESIGEAQAAVSRAMVSLSKERLELDAIKSFVTEKCDGCALCVDVCPYRAITLEEKEENGRLRRRVETDKALCKGCGLCAATCPKEGVMVHGFTMDQLKAQVNAVLPSFPGAPAAGKTL